MMSHTDTLGDRYRHAEARQHRGRLSTRLLSHEGRDSHHLPEPPHPVLSHRCRALPALVKLGGRASDWTAQALQDWIDDPSGYPGVQVAGHFIAQRIIPNPLGNTDDL